MSAAAPTPAPAAVVEKDRLLAQFAAYSVSRSGTARFSPPPFGPALWVAPNPFAARETRQQFAKTTGAILRPGVRTLRQVAEGLVDAADPPQRVLTPTQQRRLVAEAIDDAARRRSLGALEPLANVAGLIDYVGGRLHQLRLTGDATDAIAGRLVAAEGDVGRALATLLRRYAEAFAATDALDDAALYETAARLCPGRARLALLVIPWQPRSLTTVESAFLKALVDSADRSLVQTPSYDTRRSDSEPPVPSWFDRLRQNANVEFVTRSPPSERAGLTAVAANLFAETLPRERSPRPRDIAVLAGSSEQDELRRVTRRIKQSLLDGAAKPEDVVVAARGWPDRGERIASVLREYGVPAVFEPTPRLRSSPIVSTMRRMLDVARSDWAMEPLLALVTQAEFRAFDGAAARFATTRAAAEWFVRELGSPSGSGYLLEQAEAFAARGLAGAASVPEAAAEQCHDALRLLSDVLGELPPSATVIEWFDACRAALRRLHYDPHEGDGEALAEVERSLADVETLDRWRGREPRRLDLEGFAALLGELADRSPLPRRDPPAGRVRVVTAETAAGLRMKQLYLVGLGERSFASPDAPGQRDEMRLFYELVTRPSAALTLSYAALDADAQPLHPSPYLEELERVFEPGVLREGAPLLAGFDTAAPPHSRRELRLAAAGRAATGDASLLPAATAATPTLTRALRVIHDRSRGDGFGAYEGVLGRASGAALLQQYGPDRVWSASQLELYAECPFKFFARHVLAMQPIDEPGFELDARRRGSLTHDALAKLFAERRDAETAGLDDLTDERLRDALRAAIRESARIASLPSHRAILAAIEAREAERWADDYPDQQSAYAARWRDLDTPLTPHLLEAKFGPSRRAEAIDQAGDDEPFRFDLGGLPRLDPDDRLLLSGVIDRVDVGTIGGERVFAVVDYKTRGRVRLNEGDVLSGRQLQPILYTLAAERLFFGDGGATPIAAGYWGVRDKGFADAKGLVPATVSAGNVERNRAWLEAVEAVRSRVGEIVAGVRSGEFPMHNDDEHCGSRCEFSTVCRVGQARAVGKLPPTGGPVG